MCRRVVVCSYAVYASGNNLSVAYNDGTEWATAVLYVLYAGIYGQLHEFMILLCHDRDCSGFEDCRMLSVSYAALVCPAISILAVEYYLIV